MHAVSVYTSTAVSYINVYTDTLTFMCIYCILQTCLFAPQQILPH